MTLCGPRTLARWWWTTLPLLAVLFLPTTAFAQTGTITGTVTNSVTGAPIAGVPLYIIRSDQLSEAGVVFQGMTNASGVYTFTGPAGGYYIAAVPSDEGVDFVDEIYGGRRAPIDFPDLVDGTLVTITPGGTATANFGLLPGGHVTGTVTDAATGAPLANVLVQSVYRYNNDDYYLTDASTDAAGHYEIRGLAPGQIFLITRSFNVPGYIDEYWDNNPCVGQCGDSSAQVPAPTPITIVSGVTVAGKDFALDPGGAISGTVTNAANGQPIANLAINVNALVNGGLRFMGTVNTNASGVYRFGGLATGTYFASTGAGNSGFMNEIYDNVLCPLTCNSTQSGTEIPVTVRNTTVGRDFALDGTGGVITGTVTRTTSGAAIQNVTVTAVVRVGNNLLTRTATTNASGVYRLAGLPAGAYWLYTSGGSGFPPPISEIYPDIACVSLCTSSAAAASGEAIPVSRGETVANKNFGLADGGLISGTVRDSVTDALFPGQTVELYVQQGAARVFVTSTVTPGNNVFGFTGLPAGTYFLATSGRTGHRNEIYSGIPCPGVTCSLQGTSPTPVPVTPGVSTSGLIFRLVPTSSVRGKITSSATGEPLPGIGVSLYQKPSGALVDSATTDRNGNYFFTVVPAGTYVGLTSNVLGYRNEIYNDIPCTGACSVATAIASGAEINVAAGVTTGINFALDTRASAPAAPTNFRVVMTGTTGVFSWTAPGSNTTGAPASYVIDAGFSPGTTAVSLPAGTGTSFTIPNIPPGTFYLRVRAINAAGSSPPSNEVTLGMSTAGVALPEAPNGVQAFMVDGLLTMTWLQPQRGGPATGYLVEAGSASGLTNIGTVRASGRSLTFPGVPPGFYFLRVRATNAGGRSAPSSEVMIVVGGAPSPPGAPNFTTSTATSGTVTLTWVAPAFGTPTSYIIEAGSATGLSNLAVVDTHSTATTVSFAGVPPGTYYIRLRAVNALGASVVSNERTLSVP
jgi:5-hydroxyisourate hydrolase-like protein (transthyretin family)